MNNSGRHSNTCRPDHVTKEALANLLTMRDSIRDKKEECHYDDGLYSLTICEHSDGSGKSADLSRYQGNAELLNAMINEVDRQLNSYQKELSGM